MTNENQTKPIILGVGEEPVQILEAAPEATLNLLPSKSRKIYEKAYDDFAKWCLGKGVLQHYSENVLLAYFSENSKRLKSSTLWSQYSMLKATISVKNNTDISKYPRLIAFLKRQAEGYKPKKSKILAREQIDEFLTTAPDETHLLAKASKTLIVLNIVIKYQLF